MLSVFFYTVCILQPLKPQVCLQLYKNTNKTLITSSHNVSAIQEQAFCKWCDWQTDIWRVCSEDAPCSYWNMPRTVTQTLLTEYHLLLPAVSMVTASVAGVVLLAGRLIVCGTTTRANLTSTCLMWGTSTITRCSTCHMYKKIGTPSKLLPQLTLCHQATTKVTFSVKFVNAWLRL
jgi:hypothetical protein